MGVKLPGLSLVENVVLVLLTNGLPLVTPDIVRLRIRARAADAGLAAVQPLTTQQQVGQKTAFLRGAGPCSVTGHIALRSRQSLFDLGLLIPPQG